MPPRPQRKQKLAAEKKEEAERKKRILASKEKILSVKRMILSMVEVMSERDVSKEWFLTNCTKLCHGDYDDVIEERNVGHLCGYPVCSNNIKQTLKQKYHISPTLNKVYNLEERKCFCSNQCYKASNYLKVQLSSVPLYERKEEKIKVHLLSDCDNRGSAGEEVVFHPKLSANDIEKVEEEERLSNNLKNMLYKEIKHCADSLGDLKIKENVFEKPFVFGEEIPDKLEKSLSNDKDESNSEEEEGIDDSSDNKLFPSYENMEVLTDKYMPIPKNIKKIVMIPPQKRDSKLRSPIQQLSLDFVVKVFEDWMTEDSAKYLHGEKHVFGVKAEHLFERMTADDPLEAEKLESIKKEYINLCLKIDSLPDDDGGFSDSLEFDVIDSSLGPKSEKENVGNSSRLSPKTEKENVGNSSRLDPKSEKENVGNSSRLSLKSEKENGGISSTQRVFKRKPNKKSNEKGKHVTFAEEGRMDCKPPVEKNTEMIGNEEIEEQMDQKSEQQHVQKTQGKVNQAYIKNGQIDKNNEEASTVDSSPDPIYPLVPSLSQNTLRRQIVNRNLKSVYIDILPVAGLHYTNVRGAMRKFVDTLSLTPTNITFKLAEWKLISVVLLRMLTRTVLKDIWDELHFLKLCEHRSMPVVIDFRQLENIVQQIISVENILHLQ